MRIGILQTGHAPEELIAEFGDYGEMFARMLAGRGFDFEIFGVVDGHLPPSTGVADGWLVTGSRHATYEDHPWIPPLEALLRTAFAAGQPIAGICFGHQILAQALGGRVEKFAGGWAVGATEYRIGSKTLTLNAWHQDQVVERPEGARVLASAPGCENAILAYGDTALSFQPHPEFEAGFLRGLIEGRGRGVVPETLLARARARLDMATDRAPATEMIAGLFERARSRCAPPREKTA